MPRMMGHDKWRGRWYIDRAESNGAARRRERRAWTAENGPVPLYGLLDVPEGTDEPLAPENPADGPEIGTP